MPLEPGKDSRESVDATALSAAFDEAPVPAAILTLDGVYLRINAAFGVLLDHVPSALLGLDYTAITHPEDWESTAALFDELREGGLTGGRVEKRLLHSDGSAVCVAFHSVLIPGPDHEPLLLSGD